MVVDERLLNVVTVNDCYLIGNIETMLDSLNGSKCFTGLDLFSGYYNIPVAAEDRHKIAFIVPIAPGFSSRQF